MSESFTFDPYVFEGLRTLAESAFPKHCRNCGRIYSCAEQFLKETVSIRPGRSGLKESADDDDNTIVELYRNCPCGSTLMDFFSDRRDTSEAGLRRRKKFGDLVNFLVQKGWDANLARAELLKVLRGEESVRLKIKAR